MSIRFLTIALTVMAAGAHARAENFWYAHEGEVVPLAPLADQIAVFTADAPALQRITLDERGARAARIEAFAIPGWHIVTASDPNRAAGVRAMIAAALADPGIALATPVFQGPLGPGPVMLTDTIFVRFSADVDRAAQDAAIAQIPGAVAIRRDDAGIAGLVRLRIDSRNALDALDAANLLAGDPRVEFAEPDVIFTATQSAVPNDPDFGQQWALLNTGQFSGTPGIDIGATEAFDLEPGDPSTLIVVLDTGVDAAHPDLTLAPGEDFTTDPIPGDGSPVNACDNHGTWVAGCISSTINNGIGIAGGAGLCRVASARIGISTAPTCNLTWSGQLSWTVDALNWAQSIGARVTNNSNAYNFGSTAIRTTYEALEAAGIIHFASAGNDGSSSITYPASLGAVQAVGALTRTGSLASFSNFGSGLAYTAPGAFILSTDRASTAGGNSTNYAYVDGTSFASPYAATAAALVATLKPLLGAEDIELVLDNSATDLGSPGFDSTYGHGLINSRAAIELAACYDSWSPTGASGPSPRTNHAMAYDSARGVTVLFGGLPGASASSDTWEHNGNSWSQNVIAGPSARYGHAMAYDSARSVVVLHGGFAGASSSAETWEYDGASWTLVSTTGPSARFLHAMAYDPARGVTVLFGGRVGSVNNDETWEWNGATWTQVPITGPSARTYHAMTYNEARDQVVLFGGSAGGNETWVYEGPVGGDPGSWTMAASSGPPGRERSALAYDSRAEACVLFGGLAGSTQLGDTWEWNGTSWRVRSLGGPIGRSRHAMVYRDSSQDSFMFGGIDSSSLRLGDSWTWFIPAPAITTPPDSTFYLDGDTILLTVDATTIGIPTFQWRKDDVDLIDGGAISGAATDMLTIINASSSDAGLYTVVVSDPCGATVSLAAVVAPACAADLNLDGFTNAGDFTILAGNFGIASGASRSQGDLSGDGAVNSADFVILAGDFGCQALP